MSVKMKMQEWDLSSELLDAGTENKAHPAGGSPCVSLMGCQVRASPPGKAPRRVVAVFVPGLQGFSVGCRTLPGLTVTAGVGMTVTLPSSPFVPLGPLSFAIFT